MSRLVEDLIPFILEFDPLVDDPLLRQRDLSQFALVALPWINPTRRQLYDHPFLHSLFSCRLLSTTLSGNPTLRSFVKGVDICPSVTHMSSLSIVPVRGLLHILNHNLKHLCLGGDIIPVVRMFLSTPYSTLLSSLTSLVIRGSPGAPLPQSDALEWDEKITDRLTMLSVLRLSNVRLRIADPSNTTKPSLSHLKELYLEGVIIHGDLHDLCPNFWHSIRMLSILDIYPADEEAYFDIQPLLEYCSNLENIHYKQGEAIFDEDFPLLPSVRFLDLTINIFSLDSIYTLARCCANLESLKVDGDVEPNTVENWREAMFRNLFPSLPGLEFLGQCYDSDLDV